MPASALTASGVPSIGGKHLTFRLGGETYALQIGCVQEIIGMQEVTQVPRLPDYIRGVINLRGRIVPAVDLRRKFGLEAAEQTRQTCIIVVELAHIGHNARMGLIVDAVTEVADIPADSVEPAPELGRNAMPVLGFSVDDEQVRLLLDLEQVLGEGEAAAVASLQKEQVQD